MSRMIQLRVDEELYREVVGRAAGTSVTHVARTALRVHMAVLDALEIEQ
ncbi:MAG: hypothetical protein Q7J32_05205 [Sphingomonadaceae bacterium]|nr:hypothetical protein [Sphingomonadaceae bacterium]